MLLATIPAGATVSFDTVFVPQFIVLRNVNDSQPNVTAMRINVNGDGVIFNLDTAGMLGMNYIRSIGAPQAPLRQMYQLANGLVNGKNCTWTITNAAAVDLQIYGYSKQKNGNLYFTYLTQRNFANSGSDYTDFAYLAFPNAVAGDSFTVVFNDGTVSVVEIFELSADTIYTQGIQRQALDNISPARVRMVTFIPLADQNVYLLRYQKVSGNVDAAVLNRA